MPQFHSIRRYIPILAWAAKYKRAHLSGDLSAGLVVGVLLIPQGMAYAMIAGLPPIYGLYAALIPQIIYAILGTSRQLSVGPVALDSLIIASGVVLMATSGTDHYISLAILLAFFVGVFQVALGHFAVGLYNQLTF